MKLTETKLKGVFIIEPRIFSDTRGFFMETFKKELCASIGVQHEMIQDNQSYSLEAGTLRGLHFQKNPMAQTKIVRVLRGAIFDVAVDIRKDSPTFGQWVAETLTAENRLQLVVPRGFAHGFMTLTNHTEVTYKVDNYYSAKDDRNIRWDDPTLAISWPLPSPSLSDKDQKATLLRDADL